jgi:hypothetical protein
MRISTRVVIDIESDRVEERESFEYEGPIAQAKGTGTAEKQRRAELSMQQTAFDKQMAQLNTLNQSFQKYLSGNLGYSPQAMSAMRSSFLNSNNATYSQAGQQIREALGARGEGTGTNPAGGLYARGLSALLGAKAGSQSQGLLGLNVQNEQQKLTNLFNAGNILSGNAATLTRTQGVAGAGASNALDQYMRGANSGFRASFTSAFGGSLGAGLGGALTGGLGGAMSAMTSRPNVTSGIDLNSVPNPGFTNPAYYGIKG